MPGTPETIDIGCCNYHYYFIFRFYLFIFRQMGREGEREGAKYRCVRDTSIWLPLIHP